jgi:hypothetical protein
MLYSASVQPVAKDVREGVSFSSPFQQKGQISVGVGNRCSSERRDRFHIFVPLLFVFGVS